MPNIEKPAGQPGGNKLEVKSGGEIEVQSGGIIDVESGGLLKLAGTQVTLTAAELNTLDALPGGATFTIGTEDGGVITVDVQLTDPNDANLAAVHALKAYLAGADTGLSLADITAAGLAVAGGGDGLFIPDGGDSGVVGIVVCSATGEINLQVTGDAGETYYLVLVLPNGKLAISGAITFGA